MSQHSEWPVDALSQYIVNPGLEKCATVDRKYVKGLADRNRLRLCELALACVLAPALDREAPLVGLAQVEDARSERSVIHLFLNILVVDSHCDKGCYSAFCCINFNALVCLAVEGAQLCKLLRREHCC